MAKISRAGAGSRGRLGCLGNGRLTRLIILRSPADNASEAVERKIPVVTLARRIQARGTISPGLALPAEGVLTNSAGGPFPGFD